MMPHDDEKNPPADDAPIELEPTGSEPASPAEPESPGAAEPAERPATDAEPLDLEQPDEPAPSSSPPPAAGAHSEQCPNCGAPMPDRDALLCLRCGYDLKRLEVARTRVGKPVEVDEDETDAAAAPVSRPGRGEFWLPLAMAGISLLLLVIGHLSGVLALFPDVVAATPAGEAISIDFSTRFIATLQLLVLIGLWSVCGLAGLFLLAQALQRPVGEMSLAAARMLGIVATIRLAMFLDLPGPRWVEWLTESLVQGAAFIALSIVLYSLKPRDGAMMGGFSLAALVALWVFARAMVWALEGGV